MMGMAGQALAEPHDNIFGADIFHPDLELAVTSFEQVCMPFVLHKTELTREMDKAHWADLLAAQGYKPQSVERMTRRYLVEPSRAEWKPPVKMLNPPKGKFTVFDGASTRVVTSVPPTGEINMRATFVPAIYKTKFVEAETYNHAEDNRLSADLIWNFPSGNYPGKSCDITLEIPSIDKARFIENFIEKDTDWKPRDNGWSQCVKQENEEFLFTISHQTEALSLSVKRSDFLEAHPCQSKFK